MKVKILVPFRFEVEGKAHEFEPGIAELPDDAVDAFLRARYIELIEDKPAVKVVVKPKGRATKAVK